MKKVIKFGEDVKGYDIPVLNEREIRASAGILFLAIVISILPIEVKRDFILFKYVITSILTDFIIRVFISPRFSPSLIIGRLIVGNQAPEYVGAQPKKFAWIIGVVLSAFMFTYLVIVNAYGWVTVIGCLFCLVFLFFESAFGICLGCKLYSMIYKNKAQHCPGEICDVHSKQEIQKTSGVQLLVVVGLIVFIFLTALLFNDTFSKPPYDMFGIDQPVKSK
ncbi:MAG TPA: DUF4395 domain-containing protein [Chitinophagaceae bacterium]|nr:DUF4395 domain-containing protein [Chitinophagaceae bacterium]